MKKIILFIAGLFFIPCILTLGFSLFSDNIQIGRGGYSIESKYMGKDVLIELKGLYKSMDVEEYVLGVLCGSVTPDYDDEALKVQAVLIRTNVLKEMQEKNTADAADLSYQYLTVENRIDLWGDRNYEKYERRMEKAVIATAGQVLEKEDSLIMALYHEVSIGKTASAKEVLGEDVSYLQSVESSQDVEAKHYMNIVSYTWEELNALTREGGQTDVVQEETKTDNREDSDSTGEENMTERDAGIVRVEIQESTENGFVKQISVNGTVYTGEEGRQLFHLASTNFYVEEVEGGLRFVCLGKGDCLGVSQYGANYMAINGNKMEDIINYYFQDVNLVYYNKK